MESIRNLYRIGTGPSSSHTMGPRNAALKFQERHPEAAAFKVQLFGSLAATGKGHLTDTVLRQTLTKPLEIEWLAEEQLPRHTNGMRFWALDENGAELAQWEVYSIGGGALLDDSGHNVAQKVYALTTMQAIFKYSQNTGKALWEYVEEQEGPEIWDFLRDIWQHMEAAVERGISTEGVLPGGLGLARKGLAFFRKAKLSGPHFMRSNQVSAYALGVAEENASGGVVVTAPTCGSCGVVPAVLCYLTKTLDLDEASVLRALATAGLIGNLIKFNASISGAEVGCQGEIGAACSMAAGAAEQLLGGTARQIEYAAEMGLEHHLGLTCDPVAGLVQIPCIERNAFAATRALSCADYAIFTDGAHTISFDEVVSVMNETGHDLPSLYRETAGGGLAAAFSKRK